MEEANAAWITPVRSKDEVALELMRFIAETTGYAKGASSAGFAGKGGRSPEDQADALLELYERCRVMLHKDVSQP